MKLVSLGILLLLSLIIPFILVIRLYLESGEWRTNLLRAFYGNISGLILIGATWGANQGIGTNPPDYTLPTYLSALFLISLITDLYKTEEPSMKWKKLFFYPTLGLGLFFHIISVIQVIS